MWPCVLVTARSLLAWCDIACSLYRYRAHLVLLSTALPPAAPLGALMLKPWREVWCMICI
jgi:hypothetical protein